VNAPVRRLIFGAMVAAALGMAAGSRHAPTESPPPEQSLKAKLPGPSLVIGSGPEDAAG